MLFNSHAFLFLFLPITWFLFRANSSYPFRAIFILTASSLVFYSYWNPKFVFLILISIFFNFFLGRLISKSAQKKSFYLLVFGITINLLAISYFKYLNFFMENIFHLMAIPWERQDIFLPLGISFFTFQQIAYLVDAYQDQRSESHLMEYTLFVTFFPQLIAGPIVHHGDLLQKKKKKETFLLHWHTLAQGLALLAFGLFKKVVLADTFSPWVSAIFDSSVALSALEAWSGALAYTFQIYFDFSGYSDMALGLGKLFRIELPENFASPYQATSIGEFWRRWHMTLSRFLRDYLYIPLGGNRHGTFRRHVNLLATMVLGGLWHGAAWTFVLWGALHGVFLVVNHLWQTLRSRWHLRTLPPPLGWGMTFFAVVGGWVLFRAASLERAWSLFQSMFGVRGLGTWEAVTARGTLPGGVWELVALAGALWFCLRCPRSTAWCENHLALPSWRTGVWVTGAALGALLSLTEVSEFLYFQF